MWPLHVWLAPGQSSSKGGGATQEQEEEDRLLGMPGASVASSGRADSSLLRPQPKPAQAPPCIQVTSAVLYGYAVLYTYRIDHLQSCLCLRHALAQALHDTGECLRYRLLACLCLERHPLLHADHFQA
jgi:hypothetical protein